jgi:deazaflavin-dependent oxidoreductase (nitroreductase family)
VNVRAAAEQGERVGVRVGGATQQAAVRELTGVERGEAWEHMIKTWPNYARYAERTDRTIPVFYLDPS